MASPRAVASSTRLSPSGLIIASHRFRSTSASFSFLFRKGVLLMGCRRSGGKDFLVLTEPLLERLKTHETDVNVIRVQKLEEGEHCDFFWCVSFPPRLVEDALMRKSRHIDAVELCFHSFVEDIERTRPRYPEEEEAYSSSEDDVIVRNGVVGKLVDI